ncbi:YheU family protein [Bdellovibrio sp. NC01]|nr:YheU family protein [Bdellovibrio sp. NC01]
MNEEVKPPVEIPQEDLSADAIEGIIEAFILREGTDYGSVEVSLSAKKEQIRKQLARKDIKIVFDFASESVTLMTKAEWQKLQRLSQT